MTLLYSGPIGRGFDKAGIFIARMSETRANSRAGLLLFTLVEYCFHRMGTRHVSSRVPK